MKVIEIGPSPTKSKGGMATVIEGILTDKILNSQQSISLHESYCDGNIIYRFLFSLISFIKFILIYNKFDVFHIHMASYGSTFRKGYYIRFLNKKGKKIILHVHGAEYVVFFNRLSDKKKDIVKNIWNCCDSVIVLSENWKSQFQKIFRHNNIIVINNGIDIEQYKDAKCDLIQQKNYFLFLGRLGKRKGSYDIINAVEKIIDTYPNILVYMAGDGEIDEIKKLVLKKKLENNIKIVGWINFNQKIELLRKSATILLPSYNEGLPMTILEGMASGKVIISTNVGGIPELVKQEENGIIIQPGNIKELSKAMCKVIDNEEFLLKCSINNLKKIKNGFSMKIMHKKINDLFERGI